MFIDFWVTLLGDIPQQTSEETVDRVGKQRAWGDQKRRNIAIKKKKKKKRQKCNHLKGKHVKKEVPTEEPYRERSHAQHTLVPP